MGRERTQFKKGESGNPSGRKRVPEHIKKASKLTQHQLRKELSEFLLANERQVKEIANDEEAPVIRRILAKTCLSALKGNEKCTLLLLERTVGRVRETLEIQMPTPYVVEDISSGKSIELGSKDPTIDAEVIDENHD